MVNQPLAPKDKVSLEPKQSSDTVTEAVIDKNEQTTDNNNSVYQNCDASFRSMYNNRETMICDATLSRRPNAFAAKDPNEDYYNFIAIMGDSNHQTIDRSNSLSIAKRSENGLPSVLHARTQSLVERKAPGSVPPPRRIPENLKLSEFLANNPSPSHSMSSSSGPYIAISECISGTPMIDRDNPLTPLNSLDPKFYEMPRSHFNNIGLNLTNEQPYSPKRNNCASTPTTNNVSFEQFYSFSKLANSGFAHPNRRNHRRSYRGADDRARLTPKVSSPTTRNGFSQTRLTLSAATETFARRTVRSRTTQSFSRMPSVSPSCHTRSTPCTPRSRNCVGRARKPI